QVHLLKSVFRMPAHAFQAFQMAGISQAIQIDQPFDLRPVYDVLDQIRSDESGAAGDEQVQVSAAFRLTPVPASSFAAHVRALQRPVGSSRPPRAASTRPSRNWTAGSLRRRDKTLRRSSKTQIVWPA